MITEVGMTTGVMDGLGLKPGVLVDTGDGDLLQADRIAPANKIIEIERNFFVSITDTLPAPIDYW